MPAIHITVKMWIRNGRHSEFIKFENAAFAIMAKHGGNIVSIQKNHAAANSQPHEIHLLRFPDECSFEAYRNDPDFLAMSQLRETCVAKTEVAVDDGCNP